MGSLVTVGLGSGGQLGHSSLVEERWAGPAEAAWYCLHKRSVEQDLSKLYQATHDSRPPARSPWTI